MNNLAPQTPHIALITPPADADIDWLVAEVQRQLAPSGVLLPLKQIQAVARMMRMFLPSLPLELLTPVLLQALWIYLTDALVDGATAADTLEARLHSWRADIPIAQAAADAGHCVLIVLRHDLARRLPRADYDLWWASACAFLDAQLVQRWQPAAGYLDYLATRTVAQGIPLIVQQAALLAGYAAELQTARTATLLWWAGCYLGLGNDLASYEREVAEGTVATANARGVLHAISVTSGAAMDARITEAIVRRDMESAWQQLTRTLGPQSEWASLDWVIARLAQLLYGGHGQ